MRRPSRLVVLVAAAAGSLGWLDPSAVPREAARLYDAGKFDEAASKYNQALTDEPDSALLHFNLGDAEYRRGQFEAAARAFAAVPDDAAAEYNRGNALYQLGLAAEGEKPQEALAKWAEALVAYRRAIASAPTDEDAKFNYEWVSRKIEELRKKLEEQQQNPDQQQRQQDQQEQEQNQRADQQQQDREQRREGDDQQEQRPPQDEQQAQQQEPKPDEPSAQGDQQAQQDQQAPGAGEAQQGEGAQAQPAEGELSREEATALLDGERNEELRPDEVIRRQLGAGEGPVQDW